MPAPFGITLISQESLLLALIHLLPGPGAQSPSEAALNAQGNEHLLSGREFNHSVLHCSSRGEVLIGLDKGNQEV